MTIRPGMLCVIEPPPDLPEVRDQLAGLVVVAVRLLNGWPRDWAVNPRPVIRANCAFTARGLSYSQGTYDVEGLPESWLRPIRGEPAAIKESRTVAAPVADGVAA